MRKLGILSTIFISMLSYNAANAEINTIKDNPVILYNCGTFAGTWKGIITRFNEKGQPESSKLVETHNQVEDANTYKLEYNIMMHVTDNQFYNRHLVGTCTRIYSYISKIEFQKEFSMTGYLTENHISVKGDGLELILHKVAF